MPRGSTSGEKPALCNSDSSMMGYGEVIQPWKLTAGGAFNHSHPSTWSTYDEIEIRFTQDKYFVLDILT